ncbi:hypothetical protein KDH_48860 [Dictyobacter sp. S3.2.2.5]|uniref:DUF2029 domain-containing protein n=1 Tax=Dictyobacter halimunensis TaxID=3026934 RepID=A0ABQ6G067_9CHLR|nr:hypothetical protein KDH_48860 [Dictyobacter sp. S3.2.2.5]
MVFAISMALVAAIIYGLLRCFRSRWAAFTCALYLVIGGWATAVGRFDLIPSALTLAAIIFGARKRWHLAFAFLALAVTFKFYPLPLLFPFLLAQQLASNEKWKSWSRFTPLAVFTTICMLMIAVSLCLSIEGTLGPFSYYGNRPFQVESPAASLIWFFHMLGAPLYIVYGYGSLNIGSPLDPLASLINALLLGTGLIYTWWLQWRNKVDLAASCLLTLLIVVFTGKVFSAQYILWFIPLAAYVEARNPRWIAAWCLIGGLTTYIFPYLYMDFYSQFSVIANIPFFHAVIALRNLCLLCVIASLLYFYSRPYERKEADLVHARLKGRKVTVRKRY